MPLVQLGFLAYSCVNCIQVVFTNFFYFGFGWVDEPAFGVADEVVHVVF